MTSTEIFIKALPVIVTICAWVFAFGKMKRAQEQNETKLTKTTDDIEKMKTQYLRRETFDKFESNICNKFQKLFGELQENKDLLNKYITKSLERELDKERKENNKFDVINKNISDLRADLAAVGAISRRSGDIKLR